MGRSKDNERIALPCKFGTLVCEVVRNDDDYREFAIDLYRSDGKAAQVCVVGTCEYEPPADARQTPEQARNHGMVHVDFWDGEDQDCCGRHYAEPFGDGWWGEASL